MRAARAHRLGSAAPRLAAARRSRSCASRCASAASASCSRRTRAPRAPWRARSSATSSATSSSRRACEPPFEPRELELGVRLRRGRGATGAGAARAGRRRVRLRGRIDRVDVEPGGDRAGDPRLQGLARLPGRALGVRPPAPGRALHARGAPAARAAAGRRRLPGSAPRAQAARDRRRAARQDGRSPTWWTVDRRRRPPRPRPSSPGGARRTPRRRRASSPGACAPGTCAADARQLRSPRRAAPTPGICRSADDRAHAPAARGGRGPHGLAAARRHGRAAARRACSWSASWARCSTTRVEVGRHPRDHLHREGRERAARPHPHRVRSARRGGRSAGDGDRARYPPFTASVRACCAATRCAPALTPSSPCSRSATPAPRARRLRARARGPARGRRRAGSLDVVAAYGPYDARDDDPSGRTSGCAAAASSRPTCRARNTPTPPRRGPRRSQRRPPTPRSSAASRARA